MKVTQACWKDIERECIYSEKFMDCLDGRFKNCEVREP